jgi:hypothetical protein
MSVFKKFMKGKQLILPEDLVGRALKRLAVFNGENYKSSESNFLFIGFNITATEGGPPPWGLGEGLTSPYH